MKDIFRTAWVGLLATGLLVCMASAQNDNQSDPNAPATNSTTGSAMPERSQAQTEPTRADSGQPVVLIDPGKIYNQDPTGWVGKRVVLQNVMVEDADKAGNFWVGSDKQHRLLIVKDKNNPNLVAKEFHKGDIVTIEGVIHPASEYAQQETDASSGKMNKARKTSGVFLLANDVDIASSTQHK